MKGGHVLIHLVREIKQAGLHPFGMKLRERGACPHPFDTRNQACGPLSVRYKVTRKVGLPSFVRIEESRMLDFVSLVRSCVIGELLLVRPLRRIKLAGLCPSGTKTHERRTCPRSSSTRSQVGGTSFQRRDGLTSSVRYEESHRMLTTAQT